MSTQCLEVVRNQFIREVGDEDITLSPPGAGKGTQAQFIKETLGIPQIYGRHVEAAVKSGSELGLKVKQVMESGSLVSDEIVVELVQEKLAKLTAKTDFFLMGSREQSQAKAMGRAGVILDAVVEIQVGDEELVKRATGRRVHPGWQGSTIFIQPAKGGRKRR